MLREALAVLDEEWTATRQEARQLKAAALQRQLGVLGPEQLRSSVG